MCVKFRALILKTYKGTGDDGIVRGCKVGGTSEHKDGRAWDWAVSYKNAHQVAQVKALFNWLFATDAYGHKYAMARRLGIMYIIWNKHIWGTYAASSGWRNYACSGVTLCHQNHVHFSFSKAGASGKTSYWTKVVVNVGGTPGNGDNGGYHGGGSTGGTSGGYRSGRSTGVRHSDQPWRRRRRLDAPRARRSCPTPSCPCRSRCRPTTASSRRTRCRQVITTWSR